MNPVLTACIATTFLLLSAFVWAMQPVTLSVSVRQCFAPCNAVAEVRVPRVLENRQVCVTLDGPRYDSGCWPVFTGSSPVFRRQWKGLSGGRYFAQARLQRGQDTFFSQPVELLVLGDE